MKCKKPLKKRLRSFRKGRRVIKKTTRRFEHFHCCSTTRVKRLGRFCWCKDNENILNGKEILNLGNGIATALSFKTTSIILVILRKTIIFAHSDAGSTASGVSFYRSYKIIFVGRNQMRQRSFFDFRLNFRYAKIRFILLICNILHV